MKSNESLEFSFLVDRSMRFAEQPIEQLRYRICDGIGGVHLRGRMSAQVVRRKVYTHENVDKGRELRSYRQSISSAD